jgi:UDP-GlcNAc3NAcA epimerase
MKICSIVGNRPQFVKAAPLSRAIRARATEVLVHTGQHYDPALADLFFDELGIPEPEHHLGVGAGSQVAQLGRILLALEPILAAEKPDVVLVSGDTTTTLAGALAAAKAGIRLAHVEAGLRSFDRSMPEEQNRVVTDHLSDVCFCPTDSATQNLAREGVQAAVHQVGDVMFDACRMFAPLAAGRRAWTAHGLEEDGYLLVTVHRAAATDTPEALGHLAEVLEALERPAIFPVHPRTLNCLADGGLMDRVQTIAGLHLVPPVGYLDFASLLQGAAAVVTDSGGVQKEAFWNGVPCITVRDSTEWVETVSGGFNRLVGMDADAVRQALETLTMPEERPTYYGDGHAAEHIAEVLVAL